MMKFRGTAKQLRAYSLTGCGLVFGYAEGMVLYQTIEALKKTEVLFSLFMARFLIFFA